MTLEQAINHLEEELKIKEDWSCVACKEEHEQLLSWLKELQAIKEAKPSEALESLEKVKGYRTGGIISVEVFLEETEEYKIIKQFLLKSQEQEKVINELKTLVKYADLNKQKIISLAVLKNALKEVL